MFRMLIALCEYNNIFHCPRGVYGGRQKYFFREMFLRESIKFKSIYLIASPVPSLMEIFYLLVYEIRMVNLCEMEGGKMKRGQSSLFINLIGIRNIIVESIKVPKLCLH